MKQHLTKILSATLFLATILSIGCNKSGDDTPSTLGAAQLYNAVGALTTTTAQAYSVVNGNGNISVSAIGVCWSATNQMPTIADKKTSNSLDSITFASNLSGLTANTTYYVRSYITDDAGTAYSNVLTFKTPTATYATTATVSTFAGSGTAGFGDGTGTGAQFSSPAGICTDAQGNMYVADAFSSIIRKITPTGVVTTLAGSAGNSGHADGTGTSAQFYAPKGVAVDAQFNVYVADMGNNVIRKITKEGVVSTLAGNYTPGYVNGTGTAAAFRSPTGVGVDAQGNVYVADHDNHAIRKITSEGVVTTLAGYGSPGQTDATGTAAYFNGPTNLFVDAQNNIYVADANNYAIRKVTTDGVVTTVVGNYLLRPTLFTPSGICMDNAGNFFISDPTGQILEISSGNVLFTLAGAANTSGSANGVNANASFNGPQALTADAQGHVYVADYYNNIIRKIVITTTP